MRPVAQGGWDNRSFRLGEQLLVREPSAAGYAAQVGAELSGTHAVEATQAWRVIQQLLADRGGSFSTRRMTS